MHPSRAYVALVTHSSTGDVVSTNETGVLCSRAWIQMYVARHLEEVYGLVRSGRLRSGFVVVMGISSAAAN